MSTPITPDQFVFHDSEFAQELEGMGMPRPSIELVRSIADLVHWLRRQHLPMTPATTNDARTDATSNGDLEPVGALGLATSRHVVMAERIADGILLTGPPELRLELAGLAAILNGIRKNDEAWIVPATVSVVVTLKQHLRGKVLLDEILARAWRDWNKQQIIDSNRRRALREQIVGKPRKSLTAFYASPSARVLHRPSCPWAGEIGAEMMVLYGLAAAKQSEFRPCKLCRPFDEGPLPAIPDGLLPPE